MTATPTHGVPLAKVRRRIEEEIRPRLRVFDTRGGYNCCGCSTYDLIVDDIVAIIDAELERDEP